MIHNLKKRFRSLWEKRMKRKKEMMIQIQSKTVGMKKLNKLEKVLYQLN